MLFFRAGSHKKACLNSKQEDPDQADLIWVCTVTSVDSDERERSGSVVECLTREPGAADSSLTGFTALWSLSKNINPSLVLVQPRKTCSFITERLLMGRKESNQTNKLV